VFLFVRVVLLPIQPHPPPYPSSPRTNVCCVLCVFEISIHIPSVVSGVFVFFLVIFSLRGDTRGERGCVRYRLVGARLGRGLRV